MKLSEEMLIALSHQELEAGSDSQTKRDAAQRIEDGQSSREVHREPLARINLNAMKASIASGQSVNPPKVCQLNTPRADKARFDNDITQRMRYQSANNLLMTQFKKRRDSQAQSQPNQTEKMVNHYQKDVSKDLRGAEQASSSLDARNQNQNQRTFSANCQLVTHGNDTADAAGHLTPSERSQYLSLHNLDQLTTPLGTAGDDLSENFTRFNSGTLKGKIVEDEEYSFESLLSEIQQPNFKRHSNDKRPLMTPDNNIENHPYNSATMITQPQITERLFMTSLVKHTAIALAIIIPLAAVTAYAAEPSLPVVQPTTASTHSATPDSGWLTSNNTQIRAGQVALEPMAGMANPATVASVDLSRYAGQWYEIARLPMYFQRNCASDVTATYTPSADSDSISVVNKCLSNNGKEIVANGEAVPADASSSKLKVTFLPSWLRWAPFGQADYWILALDEDYQSALVGTPNKKYLWLLSRSPIMDTETYQTYRKIAQNQGYNLANFTLTPQTAK